MEISNVWAKNNREIFHYLQANYEMAACQSHIMHNAVFTFSRMNGHHFNPFMHWKTRYIIIQSSLSNNEINIHDPWFDPKLFFSRNVAYTPKPMYINC